MMLQKMIIKELVYMKDSWIVTAILFLKLQWGTPPAMQMKLTVSALSKKPHMLQLLWFPKLTMQ